MLFLYNFMMKSETSDGQDAKEEDEEVELQNLIITFKRMHKFYPVFEVINKQPLRSRWLLLEVLQLLCIR